MSGVSLGAFEENAVRRARRGTLPGVKDANGRSRMVMPFRHIADLALIVLSEPGGVWDWLGRRWVPGLRAPSEGSVLSQVPLRNHGFWWDRNNLQK